MKLFAGPEDEKVVDNLWDWCCSTRSGGGVGGGKGSGIILIRPAIGLGKGKGKGALQLHEDSSTPLITGSQK